MRIQYWHHWNGGVLNDGSAVCLGTVVCLVAGLWLVVFCHHGNVVALLMVFSNMDFNYIVKMPIFDMDFNFSRDFCVERNMDFNFFQHGL